MSNTTDEQFQTYLSASIKIDSDFLYKKGLCGLANLGNTCFMNSILQCLNHTMPLLQYYLSNEYSNDINSERIESLIVNQWNIVTRSLWYKNSVVNPLNLLKAIHQVARQKGNTQFLGYRQNDSQEFLQFFLESMHNALACEVEMNISGEPKSELDKQALVALEHYSKYFRKDYSRIVEIFYGQFYTIVESSKLVDKTELSYSYEPFNSICLEIPNREEKGALTLYNCLDHFCKKEVLVETETEKKTKQHYFWKCPNTLVFFFKRWDNFGNKIDTEIDFPVDNLDMSKYIKGYFPEKYQYECYGVVNHIGGSYGGHYYSFVKNIDGNWYKYNDSVITTMNHTRLVSENAYCIFYTKKL
jgi:ubiquitin C-terminal hydrolase